MPISRKLITYCK